MVRAGALGIVLCGCGFAGGNPTSVAVDANETVPDGALATDAIKTDDPNDNTPPPSFAPSLCPTEYLGKVYGDSRYFHVIDLREARAQHDACVSQSAYGWTHLAVFETEAEAEAVAAMLAPELPAMGSNRFYVGAVQSMEAGKPGESWVWLTGAAVPDKSEDESVWGTIVDSMGVEKPQPNDFDGTEQDHAEQVMVLDLAAVDKYATDAPGATPLRAVCECDGKAVASIATQYLNDVP